MAHTGNRDPHSVLRVDQESSQSLAPALEARLIGALLEEIGEYGAVLISDYAKGVCTPVLLAQVIDQARACGVPVLVDPARIADYDRYHGAALLTPNRVETELAIGRPVHSADDALAAGLELRDRLGADAVLVKLDSAGMVLVAADGHTLPAHPRQVRDVTGAGDMVLAVTGMCRASGWDWTDAAALANVAAGLEVERHGVAPVTWAEIHAAMIDDATAHCGKQLTLDEMALLADAYRADGRRIVLTNGCFDLLHPGHIACLQEAAGLGDVLIVAINSDRSVRRLKGEGRPVLSQADRAAMLAALACVDHVVIFDDDTPNALLARLRPDVLVKGGTYTPDGVVGREVVAQYGGTVCTTSAVAGVSTSALLKSCRDGRAAGALAQ